NVPTWLRRASELDVPRGTGRRCWGGKVHRGCAARGIDRARRGGFTPRHENSIGDGNSGPGNVFRTWGGRGGLVPLARARPERRFQGDGLAGAVVGRGAETALEG